MLRRAACGLALLLLAGCAEAPRPSLADTLRKDLAERTRRSEVAPQAPVPPALDAVGETLLWARYYIDPALHEPLGLTRAALEASPPAPPAEQGVIRRYAATLRAAAETCLPVFTWTAAAGEPQRSPARAWAAFSVAPNGGVTSVLVRQEGKEPLDKALGCATEAVSRWTFPVQSVGGRVWVPLTGRGAEMVRTTPLPGADLALPVTKPVMKVPNCVARSMRLPYDLQGQVDRVVIRFSLDEAGEPQRFEAVSPNDIALGVLTAFEGAVRSCEWTPAVDGNGKPINVWVVLPLRFATE